MAQAATTTTPWRGGGLHEQDHDGGRDRRVHGGKVVVRLIRSFHSIDRVASRLQLSEARMLTASGPNGWSPAVASTLRGSGLFGLAACSLASVASIAKPPQGVGSLHPGEQAFSASAPASRASSCHGSEGTR
jgi:hypothetical protein